ncbi:uncharacterized protein [Nicotiana sylvestris]|uniref:uncharacterized protein n=1 Tax=Nicotiana sylvestris TaxID=4096 RepID=UPI00388C7F16
MLPEGTDGYVIYCDASGVGPRYVLMQYGKVVACASRQLRKHENNYPTHDLESAAVIHALKMWRHHLYGIYVDIYTNHKNLQYIFKQKELNLRQRRWLEILKVYDVDILYHPGKANVVDDTLSRRSMGSLSYLQPEKREIAHEVHQLASLGVWLLDSGDIGITLQDTATSSLVIEVKECQYEDPMATSADYGSNSLFSLFYPSRATKMYHDIREVKIEHQKPGGLLQAIEIPTWEWEDYVRLYIKKIAQLHGVPESIISDKGAQFTANFWRSFQKGLGTQLTPKWDLKCVPGNTENAKEKRKKMGKSAAAGNRINSSSRT